MTGKTIKGLGEPTPVPSPETPVQSPDSPFPTEAELDEESAWNGRRNIHDQEGIQPDQQPCTSTNDLSASPAALSSPTYDSEQGEQEHLLEEWRLCSQPVQPDQQPCKRAKIQDKEGIQPDQHPCKKAKIQDKEGIQPDQLPSSSSTDLS